MIRYTDNTPIQLHIRNWNTKKDCEKPPTKKIQIRAQTFNKTKSWKVNHSMLAIYFSALKYSQCQRKSLEKHLKDRKDDSPHNTMFIYFLQFLVASLLNVVDLRTWGKVVHTRWKRGRSNVDIRHRISIVYE